MPFVLTSLDHLPTPHFTLVSRTSSAHQGVCACACVQSMLIDACDNGHDHVRLARCWAQSKLGSKDE